MRGIVFDFDGTLADTLDVAIHALDRLAESHGLSRISKQQVRDLGSREALKQIGVRTWELPWFVVQARKEMSAHLESALLFPGVSELIASLKAQGAWIGILTSNSIENVRTVLSRTPIAESVDCVFSGTSLFGKHRLINKLLNKNGWTPTDIIYVGDETRDIEACVKAKVKVFPVDWGFQSRSVLAEVHTGQIFSSVDELKDALLDEFA